VLIVTAGVVIAISLYLSLPMNAQDPSVPAPVTVLAVVVLVATLLGRRWQTISGLVLLGHPPDTLLVRTTRKASRHPREHRQVPLALGSEGRARGEISGRWTTQQPETRHPGRVNQLRSLRLVQCALLAVAGILLFLALRADSEQRPTALLLIAMLCLLMFANVLGIVHGRLSRRPDRAE
jgi:hypothetical protein